MTYPRPLEGSNFVLTGKLSTVRAEATAAIERLGGNVQHSVCWDTDFLVIGERPGEVKMAKARDVRAIVINEKVLLKMIGEADDARGRGDAPMLFDAGYRVE